MATIDSTKPTTVTSAIAPPNPNGTGPKTPGIAENFQSFLTLLTTQLKHQDPLAPMDANAFTQQLVQFAQVEQQLKGNDLLTKLQTSEQTAQATTEALSFVGATVVMNSPTSPLARNTDGTGSALWSVDVPEDIVSGTITIKNSSGQTVFSQDIQGGLTTGHHPFLWNGKSTDGRQLGDGNYTMTVTAKNRTSDDVQVKAQVEGTIDSVDLTGTPPVLSIGGQNFTTDQIVRVVPPISTGSSSNGSSSSGSG